jgi:hypothetical protein
VTCVLSYQVERELHEGSLALVLECFEPPPLPVHVIYPEARLSAAKARAFVDLVRRSSRLNWHELAEMSWSKTVSPRWASRKRVSSGSPPTSRCRLKASFR